MAQALLPVLFLLVVIPSESASADEPRDRLLLLVAPPSRRLRGTDILACAFLSRCHPERSEGSAVSSLLRVPHLRLLESGGLRRES